MSSDFCTDCGEWRVIMPRFKAVAQAAVNGGKRSRFIDEKLCRGCLKKRVAAKQANK